MNLKLGPIQITSVTEASGVFIGKKNTLQNFQSEKVVEEAAGDLSGSHNQLNHNTWFTTKET